MNYTEIEMDWMKEILRDKEEEIKKLKSDLSLVIKERDDNIEQNKKLEEERDKWRWKYNRLKSEFNLLQDKNKSLREEIQQWLNAVNHK